MKRTSSRDSGKSSGDMPGLSGHMQASGRLIFSDITACAALFIFATVLYATTLRNGFVYDDNVTVLKSFLISDIGNLRMLFDSKYFVMSGEMSYRPVVTLTYFIDYMLYGAKPWGYHLTNILLHGANGILCYLFIGKIFESFAYAGSSGESLRTVSRQPAFIGSLLFISHPLLTEPVNAISFREDLLIYLFYISTLICYMRLRSCMTERGRKSYILTLLICCLCYLSALFSKEMAVTLPLVAYVYDRLMYPVHGENTYPTYGISGINLVLIMLTVLYALVRFVLFVNPALSELSAWPLFNRLMTIPYILTRYLSLIIIPYPLSADYLFLPVESIFSITFIITTLLISTVIFFVARRLNSNRVIIFGALFFILTLIPVLHIIPINNYFAERYLYLPLTGIVMTAGAAVQYINTSRISLRLPFFAFLAVIIALYSLIIYNRNLVWKDELSLWSDTVEKTPFSSRAHGGLGVIYYTAGNPEKAIEEYRKALQFNPLSADVHSNLGLAYFVQGNIDEALAEYREALRLQPGYSEAHNNLGLAYSDMELFDEAIKEYNIALNLRPDDPETHNNLGLVYAAQGKYELAITKYREALRINPVFAKAFDNMGSAYHNLNRYAEAISYYRFAVKTDPEFASARYNLAAALTNSGRAEEAIGEYLAVIGMKPDMAEAHYNLGNIYMGQDKLDLASEHYDSAIKIKPDYVEAHYNLGIIFYKHGQIREAVSEFKKAAELRPEDEGIPKIIENIQKEALK